MDKKEFSMQKSWMDSKGVKFLVFCVLSIVILGGVHVYFNPPHAFEPPQTTHTAKSDTSPPKNDDVTRADHANICPNPTTYYYDGDLDGYGVTGNSITGCNKPYALYAATKPGDCDDDNPKIHPGAVTSDNLFRLCWNCVDDDCNGEDEWCSQYSPITTFETAFEVSPFDATRKTKVFSNKMSDHLFGSEVGLCLNDIDDDANGATDCNDPNCYTAYECGYRIQVDCKGFTNSGVIPERGDGTDDHRDDDGDGYCETAPCTSSADPTLKLEELRDGDVDDSPTWGVAWFEFGQKIFPCKHGPKGCIFHSSERSYKAHP